VPAPAGCTRTSRAQQSKWIDARVIIIPCDCQFSCFFVCCDASGFFVQG
jgi:hypothetical protein